MKAIKFDGDINFETIKNLLIEIDKVSKDEDIILYMNSDGGCVSDCIDLSDYINRQPTRFEIVCSWEMSSSALDLLLRVHCRIKLFDGMFFRLHLFSNKIDYRNLNNEKSIDRFLISDLEKHNGGWLEQLIKCDFSIEEIEYIKLGNVITCNTERVKHIVSVLNPTAMLIS